MNEELSLASSEKQKTTPENSEDETQNSLMSLSNHESFENSSKPQAEKEYEKKPKTFEEPPVIVDISAECSRGNFHPYIFALQKGFIKNPMQSDQSGYSVIHQATAYGDLAVVRFLVEKFKQDPNFLARTCQTPLMVALNYCHRPIIKYLMRFDPDLNQIDNMRFNPLLYTVKQMDWFSFFYLLAKGAPLEASDVNGCTLAHWAAYKNDAFMVQVLTRLGVDFSQKDSAGLIPFQRAHSSACFISMKALLDLSLPKYQTAKFLKNEKIVPNGSEDCLPDAPTLEKSAKMNCGPWMSSEIMKKQRIKAGTHLKLSPTTFLSGQFIKENYQKLCAHSKWTPFFTLVALVVFFWLIYLPASHSSEPLIVMFHHLVLLHFIICAFYFLFKDQSGLKDKTKKNSMRSALNQEESTDVEMSSITLGTSQSSKIFGILQQSPYYIPFQEYHSYLQQNKLANYFFETIIEKYEQGAWNDLLEMHQRSVCPLCLIWKPQKTRHCKRMNLCVRNYWTFSSFFNKLVTTSNHHVYLGLQMIQLVLLWILTSRIESLNDSETWVLAKVELVVFLASELSFVTILGYLLAMWLFYSTLCRVFVEIYCIGKNLTYDELYNRVHYPYLYSKTKDNKGISYLKWRNPNDKGIVKNIQSYVLGLGSSN